jgi:hypothetical protein
MIMAGILYFGMVNIPLSRKHAHYSELKEVEARHGGAYPPWRWRQENLEFKASLSYIVRSLSKQNETLMILILDLILS